MLFERDFREVPIAMPDKQMCDAPILVDNDQSLRPFTTILFVRTKGRWRYVCEYWEKSVAEAQARMYKMNPGNEMIAIAPYPVISSESALPKVDAQAEVKEPPKPNRDTRGRFLRKG